MTNYYEILGVPVTAGLQEIKAAFRRLAKQYHPDRNPNGKEFFERALKAYETLSDPALKASYDYKLRSHDRHPPVAGEPPRSQTKNWRFDDREMKRRQYYNEHIRKYAKETASYNAKAREKRTYNEYKYILLATPLAVFLFVMIMKLAGPVMPKKELPHSAREAALGSPQLRPGDAPYNFIFGNPKYDTRHGMTLLLKNYTGHDAIVCIFSGGIFARSFFVQSGYSAEVPQLPRQPLDIRYAVGKNFSYREPLQEARVMGGFTKPAGYFASEASLMPAPRMEISLQPGISEGFVRTGEKEFFEVP